MDKYSRSLKLYLVTDPKLCEAVGLVRTVQAAVRGGVTMVQLRDKSASQKDMIEIAHALKALLADTNVPLIINDNVDVAKQVDADGIHIGQSDTDPGIVRQVLGPDKIIGLSCHTASCAEAVDTENVDYLGLGPVFATSTKQNHAPPLGIDGLKDMVRKSPLPSVAIGGLKEEHIKMVMETGVDGVAVVSAICGQKDPQESAHILKTHINQAM